MCRRAPRLLWRITWDVYDLRGAWKCTFSLLYVKDLPLLQRGNYGLYEGDSMVYFCGEGLWLYMENTFCCRWRERPLFVWRRRNIMEFLVFFLKRKRTSPIAFFWAENWLIPYMVVSYREFLCRTSSKKTNEFFLFWRFLVLKNDPP